MKKILLLLTFGFTINVNAQTYDFSKENSSYFNLSSTIAIRTDNWTSFKKGIKMPFQFKFWGSNISDSIYLDGNGTLSLDNNFNGEMAFFAENLSSRGTGKTTVSYAIDGASPNRILKFEFRNVGFDKDIKDSANAQCWLYETSNVLEFRYGPNKVKSTTWDSDGVFVGMSSPDFKKFIIIEGNPLDPTVNTTNSSSGKTLTGSPINGTIYRFTPTVQGGISEPTRKITIIQNKIILPAQTQVKSVSIMNSLGQTVQSVAKAEDADLSKLNAGIYFIVVTTNDGVISEKKYLGGN